jgi:hypothetical protein
MPKKVLVREAIEDGDQLLAELRLRGFPVVAAFWVEAPETDYSRLVIATPVVNERGPDAAYRALRDALKATEPRELALDDIFVVDPKGDDYRAYLSVLRGGGWLGTVSVSDKPSVPFSDDSYVYQVSP